MGAFKEDHTGEVIFSDDQVKTRLTFFIKLITPASIDEEEFGKFNTDLGFAMKVIKHQKDDAVEIIKATNHRRIDRSTAEFLNTVASLNLVYKEPKEVVTVDMCKAMEGLEWIYKCIRKVCGAE